MNPADIITRNLAEVINKDKLTSITNVRPLKVYWGTAPTGKIHLGYLIPLMKVADCVKAGCNVKILIADLHATLEHDKNNEKQLPHRCEYYSTIIKAILNFLGVKDDQYSIVMGSSYQLTPNYIKDVYKLTSLTTVQTAKHAGSEVVKSSDNPRLSGVIYPLLQALDEVYLETDAQIGGIDQRKIFGYSLTYLPKMATCKTYKGIYLMNNMVSGLRFIKKSDINNTDQQETLKLSNDHDTHDDINVSDEIIDKMSASNEMSKIDILDTPGIIKKKINKAFCEEGNIDDNSVLDILDKLIFPVLQHNGNMFNINRTFEYGGDISYSNFKQLQTDFLNMKLHPGDLKKSLITVINEILSQIKLYINTEIVKLVKLAY